MSRILISACLAVVISLSATLSAHAVDVAKSGTVDVHSGWASDGDPIQVGPDTSYWSAGFWGVSFSDAGKGFLHNVAWYCPAFINIESGDMRARGSCAYTDEDSDKFFGDWEGTAPAGGEFAGNVVYTSGTGKYEGISGGNTFNCNGIGEHGQIQCRQTATWKLP